MSFAVSSDASANTPCSTRRAIAALLAAAMLAVGTSIVQRLGMRRPRPDPDLTRVGSINADLKQSAGCKTQWMTLIRRAAGLWGPVSFIGAAVVAGRRQPGYFHRSHHVSGLAALGETSARIMVPGFLGLGASHLFASAPTQTLRRVERAAGITTIAAGLVRVSDPRCPQPGFDQRATTSDAGHGVASIATFVLWTALPFVAAKELEPSWYRRIARGIRVLTFVMFLAAGVTTRLDSSNKGLAQRAFLGSVFAFQAATSLATPIDS